MSLTLTVAGDRWRDHLRRVAEATPGLVPVAKGNGYGLGLHRLARRTQWLHDHDLGGDTIAVGTYPELTEVAQRFHGDLMVLTPWRPFGPALEVPDTLASRVIHTVSRTEDARALLERQRDARFVVELQTSMRRHGHSRQQLGDTVALLRDLDHHPRLEGVALHLPLAAGSHLPEVERLLNTVVGAELRTRRLWISHLTGDELARLRAAYRDFEVRPRIGTDLWLGDREALRVSATVLDVHELDRGDVFGYRGRTAPRSGQLLVVSGGTAHGIGLESPTGDTSLRSRAATIARGGLDAAGFVRSPFRIDGKHPLFAEPPHMQASMLLLPQGARVPAVGDEIDARVRYTATTFDRVVVD